MKISSIKEKVVGYVISVVVNEGRKLFKKHGEIVHDIIELNLTQSYQFTTPENE